jgi:hypothetical protein
MSNKNRTLKDNILEKNLEAQPMRWSAIHPQGHIYSVDTLDPLMNLFDLTKDELEGRGWKFTAKYY